MTIKIVQNAYVARSLTQKCEELFAKFGIGPFVVARDFELGNHVYRGTPSDSIMLDVAFAQSGDLNIEVIEVKSHGPSAISDMFPPGTEGLHHVAYFCENYGAERDRLIKLGFPVASEFLVGDDVEISWIDTRPAFGHMVELYPVHDLLLGLYDRVRHIGDGWDGKELFYPW